MSPYFLVVLFFFEIFENFTKIDLMYSRSLNFRIDAIIQCLPIFLGTAEESPLLHVREFGEWCISCFGGDADTDNRYIRFFPSSLLDDARCWFDTLQLDSFPSRLSLQTEFYKTFLPTFLRQAQQQKAFWQQMLDFSQVDEEAFCQAWERFGQISLGCSVLDFLGDFLRLFYTGLQPQARDMLHLMSHGELFSFTTEESWYYLQDLAEFERL